jgi:SAM-dependent methyltransferase
MKPTAEHYEGTSGRSYYAWQRRMGLAGGHLEARKFSSLIEPNDTVLDFGCGSGAMLRSLPCARRVGVDVNPAARQEAATNGVEIYASLAEVPSSSIDVVVSNHALEHVLAPYDVCRQFLDVLVPGGRLALCLPFDDWRTQRTYDPNDINHHLYTWSPLLIGNLVRDAGFDVESSAMLTHAWPPQWAWLDAHLSQRAFDRACATWGRVRRRRQVIVRARKPAAP